MKSKYLVTRVISIILISNVNLDNLVAQDLPMANPGELGLSPSRLGRIRTVIQAHVNQGELAGAVTLVARHGSVAQYEAFGLMDIDTGKMMTRDAIFRIASMTKIFTSVAVMQLFEEGHFSLNEPVSKYIPELKNMEVVDWPENKPEDGPITTVTAKREITIRDLLRHTAGFTYGHDYYKLDDLYHEVGINPRILNPWKRSLPEFVEEISQLPLAHQPGTIWIYSYATDILGYLVEVISSDTLDVFFKKRIYQSLNLTDTYFTIPKNKLDRFPNLYRFENDKLQLVESATSSDFRKTPAALSGGGGWTSSGYGGLVTSVMDFARVLQMLLNGGILDGNRLLSRKTVELMMCDHLGDISNNWLGPGIGFNLTSAVLKDVGQYGDLGSGGQIWWAGSCNTYYFMDPEEEMIGILMMQMRPFGHLGLMGKFKRLCMQAIDR